MSSALKDVSIIIPLAPGESALPSLLDDLEGCDAEIITTSEGSRAKSLNEGAAVAKNNFLWFLHADSRVSAENIAALNKAIQETKDALYYFDLAYEDHGLASFNAMGANLRSRLFGLPYGDQGFALPKLLFEYVSGYPEFPLGEDLLFVRKLKKIGIPLVRIPSKIHTSARRYREYGWLKLTLVRQWQLMKLMRQKV